MKHQKTIAVVIPAYNCQDQIAGVIKSVPALVGKIIVVNDGSTDQTGARIESSSDPRLVAIRHDKNRGVGAAMCTGYQKAAELGAEILIKMDGDGQMRPEDLPALAEPVISGRADYAKGNRFADMRALNVMPPVRRFGNAWLSFLNKLVSGYWNVFDSTNGFTALSADAWRRIDCGHLASGYFFETSMLIELNIIGARVADVDLPAVYGNEKSHLRLHRVAARFPLLLGKGLFRRFYHRYLLRDFNALSLCVILGLPLFVIGTLYGFKLWFWPPHPGEATPAGQVMLAALPIIMGFQLLLTALILDVVFTPKARE